MPAKMATAARRGLGGRPKGGGNVDTCRSVVPTCVPKRPIRDSPGAGRFRFRHPKCRVGHAPGRFQQERDMSDKIPMTAAGKARLAEELKRLKTVERPKIVREIEEARAHGDLSENAEYKFAKEKQSHIEGR